MTASTPYTRPCASDKNKLEAAHSYLLQEGQLLGGQTAPSSLTGRLTTPHTWSGARPSQDQSLIHSPVIPEPPLGAPYDAS